MLREYLHRLPTTDLYVLNPLRALRRTGGQSAARLPRVRHVGGHAYAVGGTGVIVRYGEERDIDRLRKSGVRQIVYVADDDFAAGGEDAHLPERYRQKLATFARGPWPALRDAADIVIVPGEILAAQYGVKARVMSPAWHLAPAGTQHFAKSTTTEIVHLGTGSHIADIAGLASTVAELLDANPHARLTLFAPDEAPSSLARHPRVRVRRPLSWWRYKLALPRMRYHLALYPLADTTFNRARSANKLYEHALVGAASLMSPNPALQVAAGPDLAALFVGSVTEWRARLAADLSDPQALKHRAEATRAQIAKNDPLGRAAAVWRDVLAADLS